MSPSRRKQRLIQPRLQLRLVASFVGLSVLALALQFILLAALLTRAAGELPQDGPYLMEMLPSMLVWVLVLSIGLCLPLTFCVGVVVTLRIAGPIYRMRRHLEAVARGEDPGECTLRKDDELKDFCRALNDATAVIRTRSASKPEAGPGRTLSEAA